MQLELAVWNAMAKKEAKDEQADAASVSFLEALAFISVISTSMP